MKKLVAVLLASTVLSGVSFAQTSGIVLPGLGETGYTGSNPSMSICILSALTGK